MRTGKTTFLAAFGMLATFAVVACGPKYPNCEEDKHCKDKGEFCVDKLCRQCAVDAHCKASGPCGFCGGDYTCQKPAGGMGDCCASDLDCKNNGKCAKLPGADRGNCVACLGDSECGAGFECKQGACAPKAECDTTNPCAAGKKCEYGKCVEDVCQFAPIYFDFDESAIRADARDILNKNYDCMKKRGLKVTVEGNCDERGADEYNLALGTRRADAAKRFLGNLGAKGTKAMSYGEERPVCSDQSEDCYWKNRRADFKAQ